MSKDKDIFVLDNEQAKGVLLAWLKESQSSPKNHSYITDNGFAFYNGFLNANNTMKLIKVEKYNDLLKDYEELVDKYEKLSKRNKTLRVRLDNKSNFFSNVYKYFFP